MCNSLGATREQSLKAYSLIAVRAVLVGSRGGRGLDPSAPPAVIGQLPPVSSQA